MDATRPRTPPVPSGEEQEKKIRAIYDDAVDSDDDDDRGGRLQTQQRLRWYVTNQSVGSTVGETSTVEDQRSAEIAWAVHVPPQGGGHHVLMFPYL